MKKENIIVYPYDSHFAPILRYKSFIEGYNRIYLSSILGWGLCGKDAGYADGGSNLNLLVDNKFEEYFNICEKVIFVEPDNIIDYNKLIYPKIFAAIDSGKDIVCLLRLNEKLIEIEEYCKKKNVSFQNYRKCNIKWKNLYSNFKREYGLLDIYTPIISIIGISENTHKFSIQLELKSKLELLGYKVSIVRSRSYCEFLGFYSFPSFMYDNNISEIEKVYLFNRYIKDIEVVEKPDVIILGIPGGIIPFNNQIETNFGITAFEIFQSVIPDVSILSIFHEMYTSQNLDMFFNTIKYRFGVEIDAINIANRQIDWVEMINGKPKNVRYITLNQDFLSKRILDCSALTNIPIYNILSGNDALNMANMLIDKLAECESAIIL
jgi:peptide maturation system protein (TIGR04066 family)